MKIFLTGGAGFVGSHLADALVGAGHELVIVDDLSTGERSQVPAGAEFHELDIRSPEAAALLAGGGFDVLAHLAAQASVQKSVAAPVFDAEVNVGGTLNLLEACVRGNVGKVLFASTGGAIYGEPEAATRAQDEEHRQRPVSPYALSKLAAENYLKHYYRNVHGMQLLIMRYANVYGPRQNPGGECGVVAIFARKFLAGETPTIYGDGRQTRDYVYVGDLVRAHLSALDYGQSATLNLGSGIETPLQDLCRLIAEAAGSRTEPEHGAPKIGDLKRSVLDCSRAEELLGWRAAKPLAEGVAETVAWLAKREGLLPPLPKEAGNG